MKRSEVKIALKIAKAYLGNRKKILFKLKYVAKCMSKQRTREKRAALASARSGTLYL